jgi:molybdate transport system regulatory protein
VKALTIQVNAWAEIDGQVVLSDWRISLLQAIASAGSISGAAQELDISYKLAWERIHEMEERLGQQLVETQVGGVGGGGAVLTPLARDYIAHWREFSAGLEAEVRQRFQAAFEDASPS